ncbi:MAG: VOC family protein [Pseudomonadota bacterium]
MASIRQITPMIAVADVAASAAFFIDRLGFTGHVLAAPDYAYLARDGAAIRLVAAPPDADLDALPKLASVYFDVVDVDALWAELAPGLADQRTEAPHDQPYGMREFDVYHGPLLLSFGQPIQPA